MEKIPALSISSTRLQKSWLLPARILWLIGSITALGLFLAGLPQRAIVIKNLYQGGIQAFLTQNPNSEIRLSPWTGSSATQAGVLEDDILLAVDNVPVTTLKQANALLAGTIGTPVTVIIRTGAFPPRRMTIIRASDTGSVLLKFGLTYQFALMFVLASEVVFTIVCLGIALLIFWHSSDDWMALFAALMITMILVGLSLPVVAFENSLENPQHYWLDVWYVLAFGFMILFFYLFPSGRFASRLTLTLAAVLWIWLTLGLIIPSYLPWNLPSLSFMAVGTGWIITGVIALIQQYRKSDFAQRQQIRWIVWGTAASALGMMMQILPLSFSMSAPVRVSYDFVLYPVGQIFKACLPLAIAVAILRFRLWNIEIVVNRLLVYGSLTVLTMLGYLGTIFILEAVFTSLTNPMVSFFAAGLVAVLFEPLRQRLQRLVNRWMYGERDDPYAVLTRLTGMLENIPGPNEVLPNLTRIIGQALKVPYVAILLVDAEGQEKISAASGVETSELRSFPLIYQGEVIGQLQLARRAPAEQFSTVDLRLIENIARQAGAAAQTVRLNSALIRSRAQIVTEREEERLRIRHDLHDELGPILASQVFKLAAVRQVIRVQPEKAETLVEELMGQSQQTVAEIRRLVHGLRPPVLDQLGLVEAIRDLTRHQETEIRYEITAPSEGLPRLAPAVEVNAYRIVLEALNNMIKHAHATQCWVHFALEPNLLALQIQDNGVGLPEEYRAGVGLHSMRARAEELGGQLTVQANAPQGTCINAWLPLTI